MNVFSISPETTGTYLSQAGGEFGPEIKRAGYDALVVKGKSESPVYLKITTQETSCTIEFVDADHIWGMERVKANGILRNQLGSKYRMHRSDLPVKTGLLVQISCSRRTITRAEVVSAR